jgi:hypothetical protein
LSTLTRRHCAEIYIGTEKRREKVIVLRKL